MKYFLIALLSIFSTLAHAEEVYPQGCTPWAVHDAVPNFTSKTPVMIMLHNLSDTDIWITHPEVDSGAHAGFSSLLQAGKWSALALNKEDIVFALKCIESKPGHEQEVSCADVLAICQWSKSKFSVTNSGIFWAGENMMLFPLKAYVERQGYVLQAE